MITDILSSINLVDAFLLCVFLRVVYIGIRKGTLAEVFKTLGTLFATFISLHYYLRLGKILYKYIALPKSVIDCLAFLFLWLMVAIVFKILREGFGLMQGKKDDKESGNKWFGALLALVRGVLVCGLMFVALLLAGNKTLTKTALQATSAPALRVLSVNIYQEIYKGAVSKILPSEEFNAHVLSLKNQEKKIGN